jgi:hypothetical protein
MGGNKFVILVRIPERKKLPFGRPMNGGNDNIKINLKDKL